MLRLGNVSRTEGRRKEEIQYQEVFDSFAFLFWGFSKYIQYHYYIVIIFIFKWVWQGLKSAKCKKHNHMYCIYYRNTNTHRHHPLTSLCLCSCKILMITSVFCHLILTFGLLNTGFIESFGFLPSSAVTVTWCFSFIHIKLGSAQSSLVWD